MVRRDMVWRGKLGHGEARWVTAVEVCSGWISYGMDSFGGYGSAGGARRGMFSSGWVWQGGYGAFRLGLVRFGWARRLRCGKLR